MTCAPPALTEVFVSEAATYQKYIPSACQPPHLPVAIDRASSRDLVVLSKEILYGWVPRGDKCQDTVKCWLFRPWAGLFRFLWRQMVTTSAHRHQRNKWVVLNTHSLSQNSCVSVPISAAPRFLILLAEQRCLSCRLGSEQQQGHNSTFIELQWLPCLRSRWSLSDSG